MTAVRVYLDHNATSPLRGPALEAMVAALACVGNPSSVHAEGRRARTIVETAREQVAALAACRPGEVVFTSGATEAANTVLRSQWSEIIYTEAEHAAVLTPILASTARLTAIPVLSDGVIDRARLEAALAAPQAGEARRLLVLQAANNETGVLQPVVEIGELARRHGAVMFTDAAQAAGKMDLAPLAAAADILAISGHKLGGPAGVGALILRGKSGVSPLLVGGGQERGNRAGTESVAAIAGFGAAAVAARQDLPKFAALSHHRNRIEHAMRAMEPAASIVGATADRLPNTACVLCPGRRAETLVIAFDLAGIALSAGAACSSGKVSRSLTLAAMGFDAAQAASAVRISLGWTSTQDDADAFLAAWARIIGQMSERKVA
ncbi:MAG: cysteine desulfurase family protein [Hyphomicrobiaceae bacterium]|nr:cysteine desulfurase family protein [Hyphomicrobiaceae bacterium]